ncbi:SDR family oxidoreductase [Dehalobacter sp. DCM]|uniref:SDR family oxidoreductase n=1 Tax=Dehalobacter sp. DCM TaxID=2907827 RepID=UPI0030820DEE|nr:SDR family oxidoreductase [Dehalobacter sp. DCM]
MAEAVIPQPTFPAQHQDFQPGLETLMDPSPIYEDLNYQPGNKLQGKVALISGGDSGIGRAVSILYAKEGADLAVVYLNEQQDAEITKERIEQLGRRCLLIAGDVGDEMFCKQAVEETIRTFGHLDILVNNSGEQHPQNSILDITSAQLERTFRTNVFAMFHLTRAALPYLPQGSVIINTASITAYEGHVRLIDYSASKGAVVSFTRSMSESLCKQGIRVNGIAPGPIWTALIPASFSADEVHTFGSTTPMQRAGQPVELAPAYLFLASGDSAYMSGQILHINGGTIINN